MTQTILDTALEYLDRGWSVIPIRKGQKSPQSHGKNTNIDIQQRMKSIAGLEIMTMTLR